MKLLGDHTYSELIEIRNRLELIIFNCKTIEEVESIYIQRKLRQLLTINKHLTKIHKAMYRKYFHLYS